MSTSYYLKVDKEKNGVDTILIGSKKGAGLFCFDCGVTLKVNGMIHSDITDVYSYCPICGKKNNTKNIKPCMSFTFYKLDIQRLMRITDNFPDENCIINEFGQEFNLKQFISIINDCPIKIYKIGENNP